jgi:hypothetical protein
MDCVIRIFFTGLFGAIIGMIGGIVLIEMVNRCNDYISEHPPEEEKNKKGDPENEC